MSPQEYIYNKSSKGLLDLPTELLIEITRDLSKAEFKGLRLVCSSLEGLASPHIFTTAYVATRRRVFDAFRDLSSHPRLSQHVVELVFDSSWLDPETAEAYRQPLPTDSAIDDPPTSPEDHAKYVEAFDEQEKILEHELAPAVRQAIKNFSQVRRLIYADLARSAGLHLDRTDELGGAFRLGHTQWAAKRAGEATGGVEVSNSSTDAYLRRRYFGLVLLLKALSEPDCQTQITDLRLGDGTYSRCADGIPDTIFLALSDRKHGVPSPFDHLRELDITIKSCAQSVEPAPKFPQFPHLELLRLVAPVCSPTYFPFAPPLRKPVVQLPDYCGEAFWPKLRALELKWVTFKPQVLLNFFDRHKDILRYAVLQEIYIDWRPNGGNIVHGLKSIYPNLVLEPTNSCPSSVCLDPLIINFTLYNGKATLTIGGIPLVPDQSLDLDYDEDQMSNYSAIEGFEDEERYSSEELDFSDGGDSLENDELGACAEPC
ncbi:MAG: hypothetical protein L6R39_003542 [Caloplaca ligustica]|nr:MAG: hypothetical protein L6R39_003542 [Caloplaca ligustica]